MHGEADDSLTSPHVLHVLDVLCIHVRHAPPLSRHGPRPCCQESWIRPLASRCEARGRATEVPASSSSMHTPCRREPSWSASVVGPRASSSVAWSRRTNLTLLPHPSPRPLLQAAPGSHAPQPELLEGQHLPWGSTLENEGDGFQCSPIVRSWTPHLPPRERRRPRRKNVSGTSSQTILPTCGWSLPAQPLVGTVSAFR